MSDLLEQDDESRDQLVPPGEPADQYQDLAAMPAPTLAVEGAPAQRPNGAPVADLQIPNHTPAADGAALDAAEAHRRGANIRATFEDAGALFRAPYLHSNQGNGDATRKTADEDVNAVFKRRALEDQDRQLAAQQHQAALNAALARGDSPESIKIKDAFGGTTVGSALRSRMGPDAWFKLPGHAIPGAKEQLGSETELMKAGLKASAAGGGVSPEEAIRATLQGRGLTPGTPEYETRAQELRGLSTDGIRKFYQPAATNEANHVAAQQQQQRQQTFDDQKRRTEDSVKLAEKQRADTAALGEDLGKGQADSFFSQKPAAEALLAKYKGKDLPGTGIIGNALAAGSVPLLGTRLSSNDAVDLHKTMGTMMQGYKHLITGAASSTKEDRQFEQNGINFNTPRDVQMGYDTLNRLYTAALGRAYAKYDPRVVQTFIYHNPQYAVPGDAKFGPEIAARAGKFYEDASPLNALQPQLIQLEKAVGASSAPRGDATVNPGPTPPTATVVKEPSGAPAAGVPTDAPPAAKTVVKRQFSPSRNQTRVTYSDGTIEVVSGR